MKTRMNERIERYLEIEMWKFRNSTEMTYNAAHAMDYCILSYRMEMIYLLAWAIVRC